MDVKSFGTPTNLLICPSHTQGSSHYWANAKIDNSHLGFSDQKQTGVMCYGFGY